LHFFNYNGKIFGEDDATVSIYNRGLRYGDGLFETLRIHNGELLFFEDHIHRLFSGMTALHIDIPGTFGDFFFHKQIIDLCHKNKIENQARIRLTVFRNGNGLYEPQRSDPGYFIEASSVESGFVWKEDPCQLGVYEDIRKNYSTISAFKSLNALPSVLAGIFRKKNGFGDCLLLNSGGMVADAVSSSVFWIEGDALLTPPVSDGAVDGIFRKNLIEVVAEENTMVQQRSISPAQLMLADEIFLTNIITAITPVTRFGDKQFSTSKTKNLFQLFMERLKR
jgi:branched-chain amino acid aminotransferase